VVSTLEFKIDKFRSLAQLGLPSNRSKHLEMGNVKGNALMKHSAVLISLLCLTLIAEFIIRE